MKIIYQTQREYNMGLLGNRWKCDICNYNENSIEAGYPDPVICNTCGSQLCARCFLGELSGKALPKFTNSLECPVCKMDKVGKVHLEALEEALFPRETIEEDEKSIREFAGNIDNLCTKGAALKKEEYGYAKIPDSLPEGTSVMMIEVDDHSTKDAESARCVYDYEFRKAKEKDNERKP